MKNQFLKLLQKVHWTTRFIIKCGCIASLLLLLAGFMFERGSFMAISICQTAVSIYSISMVSGIMLDVIACRKGMKED